MFSLHYTWYYKSTTMYSEYTYLLEVIISFADYPFQHFEIYPVIFFNQHC